MEGRPSSALRIVVAGYLVRGPLGGLAWHHLQYVLGLAALGHDVLYIEDSDDYPACYDPARGVTDTDPSYGLRFAAETFDRLGLGDRWAYHDAHTSTWHGPAAEGATRTCRRADLLLNVSGVTPLRPWFESIGVRALVDTDPAFTQIRHLSEAGDRKHAEGHSAFFTFGENFGSPSCTIPDDGLPWLPTRQPIVLDAWPVTPPPTDGLFTTVMQWESYPPREYGGVRYGMKSDSLCRQLGLPSVAGPVFELAIGSENAPRPLLEERGWRLRDPLEVTRDPWSFQRYIQQSRAEFSVAKHGYVASRSGWFSERSAAYLASGRPVLVEETGFSDWMSTGTGVVPFARLEDAVGGVEEIAGRYEVHRRAAREVAAEYFDSRSVLGDLVDRAMSPGGLNATGATSP